MQVQTVYISGAKSLFFGLLTWGNKPDALNKKIEKYVNQGWTPCMSFAGYGKKVLFGLYATEGFAVTFTK